MPLNFTVSSFLSPQRREDAKFFYFMNFELYKLYNLISIRAFAATLSSLINLHNVVLSPVFYTVNNFVKINNEILKISKSILH